MAVRTKEKQKPNEKSHKGQCLELEGRGEKDAKSAAIRHNKNKQLFDSNSNKYQRRK